ncbi:hypothetical protein Pan216_36800 [Planctomycetes bacterium Pan216]|uniref:Uncharacterized protein n=1 Tax=Kolteria novifilia TaxID=2527975 RepID=A0A518B755_9BACT|nr:hypothetical protein Pan216_36800 [Planctomycetes bacterium Pan216]
MLSRVPLSLLAFADLVLLLLWRLRGRIPEGHHRAMVDSDPRERLALGRRGTSGHIDDNISPNGPVIARSRRHDAQPHKPRTAESAWVFACMVLMTYDLGPGTTLSCDEPSCRKRLKRMGPFPNGRFLPLNEINPYAPPTSDSPALKLHADGPGSLSGPWRDGEYLVVDTESGLPDYCVVTGEPCGDRRWKYNATHLTQGLVILVTVCVFLVGPFAALVPTFFQRKATLHLGLSEERYQRRKKAMLINWTLLLTAFMIIVGIFVFDFQKEGWLIGIVAGAGAAILCIGVSMWGFPRIATHDITKGNRYVSEECQRGLPGSTTPLGAGAEGGRDRAAVRDVNGVGGGDSTRFGPPRTESRRRAAVATRARTSPASYPPRSLSS